MRWFANAVGLLGFLVSLPLWFSFDRQAEGFQFVERHDWIPSIGVQYFFGVDGISALLILLTTLLGFIAILSSWTAITERVRQYYVFLLLLQTGMIGTFCALDMFLFYVFWEVMLVPMYFLIGIWGGARRLYAAIKFFLYTLVGSVVMLLAILALYFQSMKLPAFAKTGTFDVTQWYEMGVPAGPPVLVLPRLLPGLRHQGADVPVPHLAARRPRGGAHRGLRDPGRRAPEDGDLRLRALLPAPLPPGDRSRRCPGWSPSPSSASSTPPS